MFAAAAAIASTASPMSSTARSSPASSAFCHTREERRSLPASRIRSKSTVLRPAAAAARARVSMLRRPA